MAASLARWVVALLFVPGVASLNWSDDLQDGQSVYTCVGGSLLLPWNVSETGQKEGIEDIKWYFNGWSEELIALYAAGQFLATPSFSHRVQHVNQGGLYFNNVTVADSGNYTIEVNGRDASGSFFTYRRTAQVGVGDSLMTVDGNLHAYTETAAKWDNSDRQFHVAVSCGAFTYVTYPPFELEWLLPNGDRQNSSGYESGKFQLLLANPVLTGNYSCRIPSHSAAMACLPGHVPKPIMAQTFVDGVESRLTLLEAQQTALLVENSRLKEDNSNLQAQMKNYNSNLQAEVGSLMAQLENHINETNTDGEHVSFTASLSSTQSVSSGRTIVLDSVTINMGNAYQPSTGIFTAPFNGTYFFAATTSSHSQSYYVSASIVVDRAVSCTTDYNSGYAGSGSCQTVVSLSARQQVWLQSRTSTYFAGDHSTSLTGFLLFRDS